MKYCKDCRFFEPGWFSGQYCYADPICHAPAMMIENMIEGPRPSYPIGNRNDEEKCGKEAKHFQPWPQPDFRRPRWGWWPA